VWSYATALAVLWTAGKLTLFSGTVAWAAAWGLGFVLSIVVVRRSLGFARPAPHDVRHMIAFGSKAWVGSLSLFLNFRLDQVLMGFISRRVELGLYAVAVNAAEVALYLPQAVSTALLPRIAGTAAPDRVDSTLRAMRVMLVMTFAGVVVAGGAGALLLPVVFGHAYEGSVGPFLWLLPGALGFALMRGLSSALVGSGHPGSSSVGALASLVGGLALDVLLIPTYAATGAAIAATAAFWLGAVASAIAYRRVAAFDARLLVPRMEDVRGAGAVLGRVAPALRRLAAKATRRRVA
jgi:O-antigen/teichoic acid export membrane protein